MPHVPAGDDHPGPTQPAEKRGADGRVIEKDMDHFGLRAAEVPPDAKELPQGVPSEQASDIQNPHGAGEGSLLQIGGWAENGEGGIKAGTVEMLDELKQLGFGSSTGTVKIIH